MEENRPSIPGYPNLRPFSRQERERAVEMGKLGGVARRELNQKRRTFAEEIKIALNSTIQPSHPKYAEIKRMLRASGLLPEGVEPTNQLLVVLGMLQAAQKKPEAAAFLRDTIGERPVEQVEQIVTPPTPVVIGIHDAAYIAEERKKQTAEREMLESVRVQRERDAEVVAVPVPLPATEPPEDAETSAPTRPPLDQNPPDPPTVAATEAPTVAESQESGPSAPVAAPQPEAGPTSSIPSPAPVAAPMPPHRPLPIDTPGRVTKHRPGKYVCIPATFPRR